MPMKPVEVMVRNGKDEVADEVEVAMKRLPPAFRKVQSGSFAALLERASCGLVVEPAIKDAISPVVVPTSAFAEKICFAVHVLIAESETLPPVEVMQFVPSTVKHAAL